MFSRLGAVGAGRMLFAIVLACAASPTMASDKSQQAYWAGFAFSGTADALAVSAPHGKRVIETRGDESLNARLAQALSQRAPRHIELVHGALAKLDGTTSAIAAAAALDRELVSVEPIGDRYKVLVEIALQALFFDFREQQVVASYPLTLQYIDLLPHRPSSGDIDAMVAGLLYGDSEGALASVFARTLESARLPNASVKRLQVGGTTVSDAMAARLPATVEAGHFRATLAHELSKAISSNTGIALLPPSSGSAIGGAMATRFMDGRVYDLRIPEADYVVSLTVDAPRQGVVTETAAMRTLLYGAFFEVAVVEPFSGREFFRQPLRKGATKIVPASQWEVDDWSASFETLLAGLDAFGGAAAARPDSRAWLAEQKPGGRPLQQQIRALQELIQSCR